MTDVTLRHRETAVGERYDVLLNGVTIREDAAATTAAKLRDRLNEALNQQKNGTNLTQRQKLRLILAAGIFIGTVITFIATGTTNPEPAACMLPNTTG